MLSGLAGEGFSDEQVLFTYRTFNGFLLGYLLSETSAMALRDPKPGDGSFASTDTLSDEFGSPGGMATANRVPGGLSAARSPEQRAAIADAGSPRELIDPADEIDARRFPTLRRLAAGTLQRSCREAQETFLSALDDAVRTYGAGRESSSAYFRQEEQRPSRSSGRNRDPCAQPPSCSMRRDDACSSEVCYQNHPVTGFAR